MDQLDAATVERRHDIVATLGPMFAKARAERLWFYCSYQELWFSPDELEAQQDKGRFIWGAPNWTLRDPAERVHELYTAAARARTTADAFARRVAGI